MLSLIKFFHPPHSIPSARGKDLSAFWKARRAETYHTSRKRVFHRRGTAMEKAGFLDSIIYQWEGTRSAPNASDLRGQVDVLRER